MLVCALTVSVLGLGAAISPAQTTDEVTLKLRSSSLSKVADSGRLKVLVQPTQSNVRTFNLVVGVLKLGGKGWVHASDPDPLVDGSGEQLLSVNLNKRGREMVESWDELGNPARIRMQAVRDGVVFDVGFGKLR